MICDFRILTLVTESKNKHNDIHSYQSPPPQLIVNNPFFQHCEGRQIEFSKVTLQQELELVIKQFLPDLGNRS